MVINSELLRVNCADYSKSHRDAVNVLKKANGKLSYKEIARNVGIAETTVSGLLSKAEKLGLAKKVKQGIYKKESGLSSFFPNRITTKRVESVSKLIKKASKKRQQKKNLDIFSPSPRISSSIDKMSEAYSLLYATENTLRDVIRKVFKKEESWWDNRVNKSIRDKVQEAIEKQPYHAVKRADNLEYTHLGQLKEIIISKSNWELFAPYLKEKDRDAFKVTIDRAIPQRNAIGHCIPLKSSDLKVVDVRFQDILKMIKQDSG